MYLSLAEYRRRLLGCWMGKNVGGTLTLVRDEPFDFDLTGEQVW